MTKSIVAIIAVIFAISFALSRYGWTASGTDCVKVADAISVAGNCSR